MEPRFHRALGALVLLALLVLSGVAALLGNAQAPTRQLTGLVTNCADPTVFVSGATVTLVDADGSAPPPTGSMARRPCDGTSASTRPPPSTRRSSWESSARAIALRSATQPWRSCTSRRSRWSRAP